MLADLDLVNSSRAWADLGKRTYWQLNPSSVGLLNAQSQVAAEGDRLRSLVLPLGRFIGDIGPLREPAAKLAHWVALGSIPRV